jgi:hypothetical protein
MELNSREDQRGNNQERQERVSTSFWHTNILIKKMEPRFGNWVKVRIKNMPII